MDDRKELIAVVEIPKYIRKVQVSGKRKATYYKQGEKLPQRYQERLGVDYQWGKNFKGQVLLCDAKLEPIIKNKNSCGTPKYKRINGQDLHALTLQAWERSKIITAIKNQMIPEVAKLEAIYVKPIIIEAELHDTFMDTENNGQDWDVDNRYSGFYGKVFPDVLCGCPYTDEDTGALVYQSKIVIRDDSMRYVTNASGCLFVPIDNTEDRKLVFKIYHDLRPEIQSNPNYENRNNSI